jgi:hypothetical protein
MELLGTVPGFKLGLSEWWFSFPSFLEALHEVNWNISGLG